MPVYWYRYRDDLWKRVVIYDWRDPDRVYHDVKPDSVDKSKENIRRAARMIEGYALCNDWQWFGTFTLNPAYHDRSDLDTFRVDFMQWLRNQRRKYGPIAALLVPELHKSGDAWHIHGLLNGPPVEALRPFKDDEYLPMYIRGKILCGQPVYDWPSYRARFGYVDIEPIRNRDACSRYITKYITKGADATAKALDLGKHLYYVTRGLNKPERIDFDFNSDSDSDSDFDFLRKIEKAAVCPSAALPNGLVFGNAYKSDYGEVQWFEIPHA